MGEAKEQEKEQKFWGAHGEKRKWWCPAGQENLQAKEMKKDAREAEQTGVVNYHGPGSAEQGVDYEESCEVRRFGDDESLIIQSLSCQSLEKKSEVSNTVQETENLSHTVHTLGQEQSMRSLEDKAASLGRAEGELEDDLIEESSEEEQQTGGRKDSMPEEDPIEDASEEDTAESGKEEAAEESRRWPQIQGSSWGRTSWDRFFVPRKAEEEQESSKKGNTNKEAEVESRQPPSWSGATWKRFFGKDRQEDLPQSSPTVEELRLNGSTKLENDEALKHAAGESARRMNVDRSLLRREEEIAEDDDDDDDAACNFSLARPAKTLGKRRLVSKGKHSTISKKSRPSSTGPPATTRVARGLPPATSRAGSAPSLAALSAGLSPLRISSTNDHDGADQRPSDSTPTRQESSRPWDPGGITLPRTCIGDSHQLTNQPEPPSS